MLEGRFGNTSGSPYLEARISFPRLGLWGMVSFLVGTGADGTVIMPVDSKRIGIDFRRLRNPTTSEGIGGTARGFKEMAVLSFSDRRHLYSYLLNIEISAPTTHNHRFRHCLAAIFLSSGVLSWTSRTIKLRSRHAIGICARKFERRKITPLAFANVTSIAGCRTAAHISQAASGLSSGTAETVTSIVASASIVTAL